MGLKLININGLDYLLISEGITIFPELYSSIDRVSYIRCLCGQIKDTDTLKFARYGVFTCGKNNPSGSRYKTRGWVVPYEKSIYEDGRPLLHPYLEYSYTQGGYDYWKIMAGGIPYTNFYKLYMRNKGQDTVGGKLVLHHKRGRKFGFAVIRDGVQISDYVRCSFNGYNGYDSTENTNAVLVPW